MDAHIAGIPLEETALGFMPVGGLALVGLIALCGRGVGFLRSHLRMRPEAPSR